MTAVGPAASYFGWLAFSDQERRRAHDAISLLRDRDTRDELGIAGVRDAFSDLLFPGTSTIQTRAGYFLFVPWVYWLLEAAGGGNSAAHAARSEQRLIAVLRDSVDPAGTIGLRAGSDVQRLPSSVYWQGLLTWRIRRARVPLSSYHVWLDHPLRRRPERDDDGASLGDSANSAWDPELPAPPSSFPEGASFRLSPEHARYLRDRIMLTCPGTMLAFLVDRGDPAVVAPAPWAHPQRNELPDGVRELLRHAECFSLSMHGAALLYNLLVAKRADAADRIDEYQAGLQRWHKEMSAATGLAGWDIERFWELAYQGNARIKPAARRFVDAWLQIALPSRGEHIALDRSAQRLVKTREIAIKGHQRARLASLEALSRWPGASGAERLIFRWRSVQTIVNDIREPIARVDGD